MRHGDDKLLGVTLCIVAFAPTSLEMTEGEGVHPHYCFALMAIPFFQIARFNKLADSQEER
jgi:hypothetical protein